MILFNGVLHLFVCIPNRSCSSNCLDFFFSVLTISIVIYILLCYTLTLDILPDCFVTSLVCLPMAQFPPLYNCVASLPLISEKGCCRPFQYGPVILSMYHLHYNLPIALLSHRPMASMRVCESDQDVQSWWVDD